MSYLSTGVYLSTNLCSSPQISTTSLLTPLPIYLSITLCVEECIQQVANSIILLLATLGHEAADKTNSNYKNGE